MLRTPSQGSANRRGRGKEILEAITIAKMVREGAMDHMDEFASGLIGEAKAVVEDSGNGCGCS